MKCLGSIEKKLYFLIPFYIFTHEKLLRVYNNNQKKLKNLRNEFEEIKRKLEERMQAGEISKYAKCMIIDMSNRVLEHIAWKYENVREGVKNAMGGKVLNYEAKDILNQGKREVAEEMLKLGKNTFEEIAQCTRMTVSEVEELAEKLRVPAHA